jgi:hypothetical protein
MSVPPPETNPAAAGNLLIRADAIPGMMKGRKGTVLPGAPALQMRISLRPPQPTLTIPAIIRLTR